MREAFAARGHYAVSCDLLPAEDGETLRHIQGDVRLILRDGWDLMICHPPCTHLAVSGSRWFPFKRAEQSEALDFVEALLYAPIAKIALENPVGIISTRIEKPTQIIQPYEYGEPETKATCLWLKNLPKLKSTNYLSIAGGGLSVRIPRVHLEPPGPNRWKNRSRTYQGLRMQWLLNGAKCRYLQLTAETTQLRIISTKELLTCHLQTGSNTASSVTPH